MAVVPARIAVTRPVAATAATVTSLERHAIGRPSSVLPFASFAEAVRVPVAPSIRESVAGAISIRATGMRVTVMTAPPCFPSLAASIVATPGAMAVTVPEDVTVAMSGRSDVQATERPLMGRPLASASVAVSAAVLPTTSA